MRALSPDSQRIAISCFRDDFTAEATTEAVNCLRGSDQYTTDEIRHFRRTDPLFLTQQISLLVSKRVGTEDTTSGLNDQIKALQIDLFQSLTQKISTLQRQSSSLTNMDGSISRQIQALEEQLNDLVTQYSNHAPGAPIASSSRAIQPAQNSQHGNTPLQTPSTSRLCPPSSPTSLRSFQNLDISVGQSSMNRSETQVAARGMPATLNGLGKLPARIKATDKQIQEYGLNADGTIKPYRATVSLLHNDGFSADKQRVLRQLKLLESSGLARRHERPSPTDEQIRNYAINTDGSVRTEKELANALRRDGFSFCNNRVSAQRRLSLESTGQPLRKDVTDEQFKEYLLNADGSVRNRQQVADALHSDGFRVSNARITAQIRQLNESTPSGHAAQHDRSTIHALIDE